MKYQQPGWAGLFVGLLMLDQSSGVSVTKYLSHSKSKSSLSGGFAPSDHTAMNCNP